MRRMHQQVSGRQRRKEVETAVTGSHWLWCSLLSGKCVHLLLFSRILCISFPRQSSFPLHSSLHRNPFLFLMIVRFASLAAKCQEEKKMPFDAVCAIQRRFKSNDAHALLLLIRMTARVLAPREQSLRRNLIIFVLISCLITGFGRRVENLFRQARNHHPISDCAHVSDSSCVTQRRQKGDSGKRRDDGFRIKRSLL